MQHHLICPFAPAGPVGVGIAIARDPLHRSGQALLTSAPTLGDNAQALRRIGMTDPDRGEPALDVSPQAAPRQGLLTRRRKVLHHRRPTAPLQLNDDTTVIGAALCLDAKSAVRL